MQQLVITCLTQAKQRWRYSPTARRIALVYSGDLVSKILAVVTTILLIRGLTTVDYASYIAFISIAGLSASLVGSGINNALVRFSAEQFSRTGTRPYTLNLLSVAVQMGFFLCLFVTIALFSEKTSSIILGSTEYANIVTASLFLGFGILLIEAGRSMLQAEERFKQFTVVLWLKNGGTLVVVGGLWIIHKLSFESVAFGLSALYLTIGLPLTALGTYGVFKIKAGSLESDFKASPNLLRDFFSATGWLIAYGFTLTAFSRIDIMLLSRYSEHSELAIYGVALQYYSLAILLLSSIQAVLRTKFSRVDMQDKNQQRRFLRDWLRLTAWGWVPLLGLILFGKPIFVLLNGQEYESAFIIFCIMSFGVWLSLMFSPLVNILIGRKDFKFLFGLGLVAFSFSLLANYVGIRNWGALGAAIALVLTHNLVLQMPILWRIRS